MCRLYVVVLSKATSVYFTNFRGARRGQIAKALGLDGGEAAERGDGSDGDQGFSADGPETEPTCPCSAQEG